MPIIIKDAEISAEQRLKPLPALLFVLRKRAQAELTAID
jgi:hypothetical protein